MSVSHIAVAAGAVTAGWALLFFVRARVLRRRSHYPVAVVAEEVAWVLSAASGLCFIAAALAGGPG